MNREEINQTIRAGDFDPVASVELDRKLLQQHAEIFAGVEHTPFDDVFLAARRAATALLPHAPDPRQAGVYMQTEMARSLILGLARMRKPQSELEPQPKNDKEREERRRHNKVFDQREEIAQDMKARAAKKIAYYVEDLANALQKCDDPEWVRRMLLKRVAANKVVTQGGKVLAPTALTSRTLPSASHHRVRIAVMDVLPDKPIALVKVTWQEHPRAIAMDGLLNRMVRMEFRRFKMVERLGDLLLSLRLVRTEVEVVVAANRALRPGDRDEDLLVLKDIRGLRELASEVPVRVRETQESLWASLKNTANAPAESPEDGD